MHNKLLADRFFKILQNPYIFISNIIVLKAFWLFNSLPLNTVSHYHKIVCINGQWVYLTGWYVPTDAEWTTLTTYLGSESIAGGKLKETGSTHWRSPNAGATNESGFTTLPGGHRDINGTFRSIGDDGFWWSVSIKFLQMNGVFIRYRIAVFLFRLNARLVCLIGI